MRDEAEKKLLEQFQAGDTRALARILTLIENRSYSSSEFFQFFWKRAKGKKKLGITGPPGAGKSSLIEHLVERYRRQGRKVACLLIDPSSPFSGGAVLGDRIRLQKHFLDPGVFIRSVASRGERGGISRSALEMILVLDAFGVDEIIIETLGVGQAELEIASVAETVVVVLTPEAGDAVQALKAGLLEVGDIFVINKADRPQAQSLYYELKSLFNSEPEQKPVLLTSALEGRGIDQLFSAIEEQRGRLKKSPSTFQERLRRKYFLELVYSEFRTRLEEKLKKEYPQILEQVCQGKITPQQALEELKAIFPD